MAVDIPENDKPGPCEYPRPRALQRRFMAQNPVDRTQVPGTYGDPVPY